jgi:4-aminobutyrate aminotransferase-like enzyme
LATLDVLADEKLVERAAALGSDLGERLVAWETFDAVTEVRGRGLLWGIELVSADLAAELSRRALKRGILLLAGGRVAQIVPPLVIRRHQVDAALDVLETTLQEFLS